MSEHVTRDKPGADAFTRCTACGGMGFLRTGSGFDRKFDRCGGCKGCGQVYLKPPPDRYAKVPEKV